MTQLRPRHADDCEYHAEQNEFECTCGKNESLKKFVEEEPTKMNITDLIRMLKFDKQEAYKEVKDYSAVSYTAGYNLGYHDALGELLERLEQEEPVIDQKTHSQEPAEDLQPKLKPLS